MYRIGIERKDYQKSPWDITFEERYEFYKDSMRKHKKINVMFYESPDASTFRYRAYNLYDLLSTANTEWISVYFFNDEIQRFLDCHPVFDFITIIRVRWNLEIDKIIKYARSNQIFICFDIDDLVFNVEDLPLVCDTSSVDLESDLNLTNWFGWFSRMNETAKYADAFITTNKFLADKINSFYKKPVFIIRNSINKEQMQISDAIYKVKEKIKPVEPFCIGYFSGSYSHNKDFDLISEHLYSFMERHKDVVLKIVGHLEVPNKLKKFDEQGRILWIPYLDFRELQREIASVDINVIPLLNNDFTNSKSELKFYEAAVVGTVSCASKTYIYENVIEDGVNGFLCEKESWISAFEKIYDNKCSIKNLAVRANSYCRQRYYGENVLKEILDVYEKIYEMSVRNENS